MNKNVINCKKREFVPGQILRATVKGVNETGVMVKMPSGRGSGVISPRCWGSGVDREKALAAIRPGDEFDVVVRFFDAHTITLSLVLADCGQSTPSPSSESKPMRKGGLRSHGAICPGKPEFKPIASGTVLLWDASNLLGAIKAENAAQALETVARALSGQGYGTMFFFERRCLTWARHNQRTDAAAAALDAFARRGDVVLVENGGTGADEADCAILQMAEALPGSVCVSRDRFGDYAHVYPDIVGTSRVRSFSVAKIGGKTMILVNGIAHAIVIEDGDVKGEPATTCAPADSTQVAAKTEIQIDAAVADQNVGADAAPAEALPEEANANAGRSNLLAVADGCVRRGRFHDGHFSAKRKETLRMALFADGHKAIQDYFKRVPRRARRTFGYAA